MLDLKQVVKEGKVSESGTWTGTLRSKQVSDKAVADFLPSLNIVDIILISLLLCV